MDKLGRVLVWLGVLGLLLGFGPLVVVGMINPKSTAVGPGLLMVALVPPSFLCWAVGAALRKVARRRDPYRVSRTDRHRAWGSEPVRHEHHDRHGRAA